MTVIILKLEPCESDRTMIFIKSYSFEGQYYSFCIYLEYEHYIRKRGKMSMQLDKNAINKLLILDDSGLWAVIRMIAAQSGIALPESISATEMSAIRRALGQASDADIAAAGELITKIKEKNGG